MRSAIAVLLVAVVAVNAKTRRPFPLPASLKNDLRLFNMPDEKIVGGQDAGEGDFPYQVSFRRSGGNHFCGAAIYSNTVMICAGHCVDGQSPTGMTIAAGSLDISGDGGQTVDVVELIQHEEYNAQTIENDISLVKLGGQGLTFNDNVAAVSMPEQGAEYEDGSFAIVSGWGTTASGGDLAETLQWVEVPYVNDDECRNSYGESDIADSMICAGAAGVDSCQGDSGGPMTCDGVHCGIVSWGYGCAVAGYPGVYTQTSYFVDWIQANA